MIETETIKINPILKLKCLLNYYLIDVETYLLCENCICLFLRGLLNSFYPIKKINEHNKKKFSC